MKRFATTTATLLLLAALPAAAKDVPSVVVQQLLQTRDTASGRPIAVPNDPTLIVSTYSFKPGAKLPVHKHLHARYAYVLEGTIRVTSAESGKSETYKRGDFIVEMIDEWHHGVALGASPVKLLVIDQIPDGQHGNVVLQK
ncbi:MAG: gentisate 1,2-dioxygenase [Rhodospirillales bacterium]|nr:gentisate 1,2-dioxygenase [Rhodospirillales bacterium]